MNLKKLTQAVFEGLPPEYRWAYLDRDGDPCVIGDFEAELDARFPDHQPDCYEDGLELATWMDSVLWRKESIHDVARSIEAARAAEQSERTEPRDAIQIADAATQHMRDRAATYDQPQGERSMGKAVAAFNAITGRDLAESEGWLLLQLLKDARQWSNAAYHQDSAEDCIAYAALKAEALEHGK